MALDFSAFLTPQVVRALQQELTGVTPPEDLFNPVDVGSFEGQATSEEEPYINKKLDLAMRSIDQKISQYKATAAQTAAFEQETATRFRGVEDKAYGRLLEQAQSGFAGRGTSTSGFRRGSMADLETGRQDRLGEFEEKLRQSGESRALGMSQFLEQQNLGREATQFDINEEKRRNIIQRQLQLSDIAGGQRQSQQAEYDRKLGEKFAGFLSSKAGG